MFLFDLFAVCVYIIRNINWKLNRRPKEKKKLIAFWPEPDENRVCDAHTHRWNYIKQTHDCWCRRNDAWFLTLWSYTRHLWSVGGLICVSSASLASPIYLYVSFSHISEVPMCRGWCWPVNSFIKSFDNITSCLFLDDFSSDWFVVVWPQNTLMAK